MTAIRAVDRTPGAMPSSGAGAGPDPSSRRYRYLAAAVIALGSTSSILSSTVVNVAVPALQRVFSASLADIQWIITGYLLGLAAAIPVSGYLTDRFGSKRVYTYTLAAFTVTSLLCGFAWNTGSEIGFRVLQGLAGGMVMPVGMTILMRITPVHERGRMMGILGVPLLLAPALGPALGGYLLQVLDWRWIFWINVPAGALAIYFGNRLLRETPRLAGGRLDVVGLVLATPGIASVIFGFTQASTHGWGSARALLPLIAGGALVAAFVWWELRQEQPLLDIRVLNDSAFAAAMGVSVVLSFALFGPTFLIPVFLQQVQGYDTLGAGLLIAAQGIGAAAMMPLSGYLTDRFGARPVVFFGMAVMAAISILMTLATPQTSATAWVVLLGVRGLGMGFAMMPSFSAAYISLPPAAIGRATALSNTAQRVASSFGVAVLATVAASRVAAHLPPHLPHTAAARGIAQ